MVELSRELANLEESIRNTEVALIRLLDAKRGIADATGKGKCN